MAKLDIDITVRRKWWSFPFLCLAKMATKLRIINSAHAPIIARFLAEHGLIIKVGK